MTSNNTEQGESGIEQQRPMFVERGPRPADGSGWDYWGCPVCGASLCSFCDCPECEWYDADAWNSAVRDASRELGDIYSGGVGVVADA